jgi:ferritin
MYAYKMLDERIHRALNKQLNSELYLAYLYLSMASYFDYKRLKGFTHFMKKLVRNPGML